MNHFNSINLIFKAFCAFILIAFSQSAFSQAHGYLGKPISLNYEFSFMPNFFEPNAKNNTWETGNPVSAVKMHHLVLDYQISRTSVISIGAGYSKTGADLSNLTVIDEGSDPNNFYAPTTEYRGKFQELNVWNTEIRYTVFDGNLAPVGFFTTFKAGMTTSSLTEGGLDLSRGINPNPTLPPRLRNMSSTSFYYFGFILGKQRIILDRFTFKYGVEINFSAYSFDRGLFAELLEIVDENRQPVYTKDLQEGVGDYINGRVTSHMGILFKVSVGVLAP